ncbi:ATP-dependent helicase [Portibacter lacus]|uniref:DNA 3'-5' helicase n=1 Tax=Portibacter lacus TaxID=1099794 RepID=A0AA37SPQ2_9BACT|nr:UvrD-helicase domain-containing protein [Portibacter lacus]GLR17710.1 DNA-dependent ATPase [Portibacter lacus]
MSTPSSQDPKSIYQSNFKKALATLNNAQRAAVQQTDGAVLVIAGPGTGKTQLLAARIGYILQETDTNPANILALTFTDAGAVAMRKRLLQFIGPEAYNVSIYTFHAFCSKIIQENIEFFGGFYDLQAVSELEQVEILKKIIDDFSPDHVLKRFKGNIYYERKPLLDLFSTIKQEGWDVQELIHFCEGEIEKINDPDNIDFQYKRASGKNAKGDQNWNKIRLAEGKLKKLIAGLNEFKKYERLLAAKERFDYNDMILWVIQKFEEKPELLLEYQERFQYILVDEYQDTNGSQNKLINLLASFWEDPNLFVVGDDDQSIYRFQGANMDNIKEFASKYNPNVVVLENNYRSSQLILDSATKLIEYNSKRLVNEFDGQIKKALIESRNDKNIQIKPHIQVFPNHTQEEIFVANEIIKLHQNGEDLSDVAIIYTKHIFAENIVKYLELHEIPLNIKRRLNVLDTPEVQRILNILSYIEQEGTFLDTANNLLFEILHYEYFGLRARDVGKVAVYCSRRTDDEEDDRSWDGVLTSLETLKKIGVSDPEKMHTVYEMMQAWIGYSKNMTLQVLFERILTEGNIINSVMNSQDRVWRLQLVNTFFDFLKAESVKKPDLNLTDLLEYIDLMKDSDIRLPFEKIISNEKGVNFLTAHGSKGLEFDRVYMIRNESKNWESKRGNNSRFTLPEDWVPDSNVNDVQDDRRLFFVAMTRAKNYLSISYAEASDEGKVLEPSRFITEIEHVDDFVKCDIGNEEILKYKADLMKYRESPIELIDANLVDRILENFSLSVTNLNKYLKCPLTFYFESVLRVPLARNANMGFGKAMHFALEQFFIKIEEDPERRIPPVQDMQAFFGKGMDRTRSHYTLKEYTDLLELGKRTLEAYYTEYVGEWSKPHHYKVEYKVDLTEFNGVPIKGVLDRVDIYQNHIEVTDYKTGKYANSRPKLKPSLGDEDLGGDYWRQIVFYQILLNADPKMEKPMRKGTMDYLEPDDDKFKRAEFEVSDFEIVFVGEQLSSVYQKIKNKEFSKGCNEDDCKWCNFVNNNFALETTLEDFEEEER